MKRIGSIWRATALAIACGMSSAALAETATTLPGGYTLPGYIAPGSGSGYTLPAAPRAQVAISTPIGANPFINQAAPNAPVPPRIEHHIVHMPQQEPLWCWAAAAQQAIGWINGGRAPAQCAIVALAHGIDVNACCADVKGICAKTGEIPAIARLVNRFGGIGSEIGVPRDPQLVYRILQGQKTLLIRLRPEPHEEAVGIRHMIVVRGVEWYRMPNGRLRAILLYNDPLGDGQRSVDFKEIEPFFEQALLVERR